MTLIIYSKHFNFMEILKIFNTSRLSFDFE